MGKPYSLDLRKRVVAAVVTGGLSCNQAAKHFGVAVSTAIGWVRRQRETGSVAPGKMGGHRQKAISGEHRAIGLKSIFYGTHSMRRTKVTQIYRKTGNLRAVQLLLGHTKLGSTVRYLGIEVDDVLHIAEQIEPTSSHRIPPIPSGRLRAKKRTFPENQVFDPIPSRILTGLAVSPSPLRRKVLEFK